MVWLRQALFCGMPPIGIDISVVADAADALSAPRHEASTFYALR